MVTTSAELRYVARVPEADVTKLRELHAGAARTHKSLPEGHPRRRKSRELSELLARLHYRGVPIDDLAEIIGKTHQAVRSRITSVEAPSFSFVISDELAVHTADAPEVLDRSCTLVVDSGIHRRLLVYPDPHAIPAVLRTVPLITLPNRKQAESWLESVSPLPRGNAVNSTPLRTPPAVYVKTPLVDSLLVQLTPSTT